MSNGHVKTMGENLRSDILKKILEAFPEINEAWLLRGEGEMLRPDVPFVVEDDCTPEEEDSFALQMEATRVAAQQYRQLLETIESNAQKCESLMARIQELEKKVGELTKGDVPQDAGAECVGA